MSKEEPNCLPLILPLSLSQSVSPRTVRAKC